MTGDELTELRMDLGLTQKEMAAELGISVQNYRRFEQAKLKSLPGHYALAVQQVETKRRNEVSAVELKIKSKTIRDRYNSLIETRQQNSAGGPESEPAEKV